MSVDHHLWVFSIHPYKTETRQNTPLSLMCGQLCGKYYFDKVKQNTSSGFITGVKACSEILSLTLILDLRFASSAALFNQRLLNQPQLEKTVRSHSHSEVKTCSVK